MLARLKMAIYQLRLKLAPRCGRLVPESLKRRLKPLLAPPVSQRDRIPYEAGAYPEGINLIGYLKAQMGLGQGARLYARAIEAGGLPHAFINTTAGNAARHQDTELDGKLTGQPVYNTNLIHVNAEQMGLVHVSFPMSAWDRRYNIGVWLWELETLPADWHEAFRYLDEIWTPSTFTSRAVATVSPVPVTTIPYGICAETDPQATRRTFGLPADDFLFLTMYDVKSIMARKNPAGAIKAFLKAFGDGAADGRKPSGVGLVVKVNNATAEELAMLRRLTGNRPDIHIINAVLSKPAVNSLIQVCDAMVSLHRSEGFGLVMAEAMFLGVPVVATNWSANTDFMDERNSCPVAYTLIDTGTDYYKSKAGQRWADPDLDDAARQMRRLVEDPAFRRRIAEAGRESIRTRFSPEESARQMRRRLEEIGLLTAPGTQADARRKEGARRQTL